jgi:hypothetical protein
MSLDVTSMHELAINIDNQPAIKIDYELDNNLAFHSTLNWSSDKLMNFEKIDCDSSTMLTVC